MATNNKKPAASKASSTPQVTRIVAKDTVKYTSPTPKTTAPSKKVRRSDRSFLQKIARPFVLLGGYFRGSWYELRQVRWPDRKATWSLTAALVAFTGFFVVVILLLDALFKYLFQLILG